MSKTGTSICAPVTRKPRLPALREGWCDPEEPWRGLGFRPYAPRDLRARPRLVLGAEVDDDTAARAARDPLAGIDDRTPWPVRNALGWQSARGDFEFLRFAHQCGGERCIQRYVVGVALTPTPAAAETFERALAQVPEPEFALPGEPLWGDELPALGALAPLDATLRTLGLTIAWSYPRITEAFLPVALVRDGVLAARSLAPWVEETLPPTLDALRRPCTDPSVQDPRWTLFVLGENSD